MTKDIFNNDSAHSRARDHRWILWLTWDLPFSLELYSSWIKGKENSKIKEERQLSWCYTCCHRKPTFSWVTSGALKLTQWRWQERHSYTICRKSSVTGSSGRHWSWGGGDPESRTLSFLVGRKGLVLRLNQHFLFVKRYQVGDTGHRTNFQLKM